jgi:hypothetical protein
MLSGSKAQVATRRIAIFWREREDMEREAPLREELRREAPVVSIKVGTIK